MRRNHHREHGRNGEASSILRSVSAVLAWALAFAAANPANAQITVLERAVSYAVTGKTGSQLWHSIIRRGPRGEHGVAKTDMRMKIDNIRVAMRANRCSVANVDVHLDIVSRVPRWIDRNGATPALRQRWRRFSKRLREHENRHIAISRAFATAVRREVRRERSRGGGDCAQVSKALFQRIESLRHAHDRSQGRLDSRKERSQRLRALRQLLVDG